MEETLATFFTAVNDNDVDGALNCCSDDIEVTYPDPGRNWKGKERGRVVMTAIFGQLARIGAKASYQIVQVTDRAMLTEESWGHPKIRTRTTYTFDSSLKIVSMNS